MPYGLKRFQQAESLHFITFSCFHRLPYLTPEAKPVVEAILEQTRSRHQARIYAYVLMPEHVHLLMNEPPNIPLDQFLKSFKQTTSRKLKGTREQFWQHRYFDRNIRKRTDRRPPLQTRTQGTSKSNPSGPPAATKPTHRS